MAKRAEVADALRDAQRIDALEAKWPTAIETLSIEDPSWCCEHWTAPTLRGLADAMIAGDDTDA